MTTGQEKIKNVLIGGVPISEIKNEVPLPPNTNIKVDGKFIHFNGWINAAVEMPIEHKEESDTLQGHREWTESNRVLAWDSVYGPCIDWTKNGEWASEKRGGYQGQVVHGIIAWMPIPDLDEEVIENIKEKYGK
jgi:hypothetical protein